MLDPDPAERYAAFADFFAHEEPDFDGYCARVRAQAGGLFPASIRMVDTQDEMRAALPDAQVLVVESLEVGRDDLAAARKLRLIAKIRRWHARHRHRRLRRARHPRAHHPPARQHRLRRAHARADAGAGAQAQPHDRPHQPREARGGRPSLPAVRPPPHAELELGAHPRRPHAQWRDARYHRAWRDRTRDRDPRRRLRHAHSLFPAPAAAGGGGARARRELCAARYAAGRGRLGGAAASRGAFDSKPHRCARSSRA